MDLDLETFVKVNIKLVQCRLYKGTLFTDRHLFNSRAHLLMSPQRSSISINSVPLKVFCELVLLVLSRTCYFPGFLEFSFSVFMCMCVFYGTLVELFWTNALELLDFLPS